MASTVWKGHLTFGLVSVPVRLIRAARPERVKLRQLYRSSQIAMLGHEARSEGSPSPDVPTKRAEPERRSSAENLPRTQPEPESAVAPVRRVYQDASGVQDQRPIERADLVKGYEYAKDEFVVLDEQDLRAIAPQTSTELEIADFVRFSEVDPVYLETSYYVLPEKSGEKAYALLFEAMRKAGYAAIGQLTMHRRDHVIILRTGKTGLIAHTMFYPDEMRTTEEFRTDTSLVAAKELNLAEHLIQALAKPFEPAQFKNRFRERLERLIESRAAGLKITQVEAPRPAPVADLMAALQRSLATAKGPEQTSGAPPETALRKPATGERAVVKRSRHSQGKRR
jgi:DNA end-binding protein Ku